MGYAITTRRVTSAAYEQELKTVFPIRHSRKPFCHWWNILKFSPEAFKYHVDAKQNKFIYMGVAYDIVLAEGVTADNLLTASGIGASMRAFTNSENKTFYICVVTIWRGES